MLLSWSLCQIYGQVPLHSRSITTESVAGSAVPITGAEDGMKNMQRNGVVTTKLEPQLYIAHHSHKESNIRGNLQSERGIRRHFI